jgi:hypothetical protein
MDLSATASKSRFFNDISPYLSKRFKVPRLTPEREARAAWVRLSSSRRVRAREDIPLPISERPNPIKSALVDNILSFIILFTSYRYYITHYICCQGLNSVAAGFF